MVQSRPLWRTSSSACPFGLVVAGAGVGAGADGAHLDPAGDASLLGGGEEIAGGFGVGLLVGDVGGLGDDADEIDDGLDAGHRGGKRLGLEGIALDDLHGRMMRFVWEGGYFVRITHEQADAMVEGEEFPDDFASHKSGSASNENHRTLSVRGGLVDRQAPHRDVSHG